MTTVYISQFVKFNHTFVGDVFPCEVKLLGIHNNKKDAFNEIIDFLFKNYHSDFLNYLVPEDHPDYGKYFDKYSKEADILFKSSIKTIKQLHEYSYLYNNEYFQNHYQFYTKEYLLDENNKLIDKGFC